MQVIFAVDDLSRTLDFYERVFGWARNTRIDFENYVELLPPDGGSVGFYERSGFAKQIGAQPVRVSGDHVAPAYLYVRVGDVRAAVSDLEAAGRPLSSPAVRSWGEEAAWFADPDGNVIAVAQQAGGLTRWAYSERRRILETRGSKVRVGTCRRRSTMGRRSGRPFASTS